LDHEEEIKVIERTHDGEIKELKLESAEEEKETKLVHEDEVVKEFKLQSVNDATKKVKRVHKDEIKDLKLERMNEEEDWNKMYFDFIKALVLKHTDAPNDTKRPYEDRTETLIAQLVSCCTSAYICVLSLVLLPANESNTISLFDCSASEREVS
jgi:hypothetical protein